MPYPPKTSRDQIVAAAMGIIGQETLSMRAVARKLGLAPNALYYYFPDRKTLEAAVAAEGTRRIHAVLKKAAARSQGASGVRAVCRAYLRFARSNPALYAMMMRAYPGVPELAAARADLRRFTLELFAGHTDPATAGKASFAAWSLLHGLVVLERGGLLEAKLSADAWFAISALLSGLSSR